MRLVTDHDAISGLEARLQLVLIWIMTDTTPGPDAPPPSGDQEPPPVQQPDADEVFIAPHLPSAFKIPTQLLEAWFSVPEGNYVDVRLTRQDFDRFYFAISNCLDAQWAFQGSMIDHTNGRTEEANAKLREAQRLVVEGKNDLRQLMAAIIASATVGRRSG